MKRVLAIVFALLALGTPAHAQTQLIYAAASLTEALQEAVTATGNAARFSFAASSTLARQIENGAPADIFASADEEWADYLQQRGKLVADTRRSLLSNRLVIVAPADQPTPLALETPGAFAARWRLLGIAVASGARPRCSSKLTGSPAFRRGSLRP